MKKNAILAYLGFMILMAALGASDAMRGVFMPIFGEHFARSNAQLSALLTVSYIGNLVFLLIGGRLADRKKRKPAFLLAVLLWLAALILYLLTDSYPCLVAGMFFSMGASTLTSTLINVMTSYIFTGAPAAVVSTLYFIQTIGTTGSQKLAGSCASGFGSWKIANAILLALGAASILVLLFVRFPDRETLPGEKNFRYRDVPRCRAFPLLVLVFGFYCIAEHSIMNWFVSIGTQAFGLSLDRASTCLALFFGGIMVGRLVFAPLVQKLGVGRSILLFGGAATALYAAGGVLGEAGIWLLVSSGIFFSILYPSMVMLIRSYYPDNGITTATGVVISAATLFDIGWNAVFGGLMDRMGAGSAYLLLPAAMLLFFASCCLLLLPARASSRKSHS